MAKSFEDRDGWIWMNGNFIPWKNATSHIVSQGLHYASAVFEGERAYNGIIFKSYSSSLANITEKLPIKFVKDKSFFLSPLSIASDTIISVYKSTFLLINLKKYLS